MRTIDFTPLYRSAIGFDHFAHATQRVAEQQNQSKYPRYNIVQVDDKSYQITLAVAGFDLSEIDIEVSQNEMNVIGKKAKTKEGDSVNFLYQGIQQQNFERRFELAEHIEVIGADLDKGLLTITLEKQVPEALKPRKVLINKH